MGKNLDKKNFRERIWQSHPTMNPGDEIYVKVDQTLTHDINAVMTYLAFEAIGLEPDSGGDQRQLSGSQPVIFGQQDSG